MLASALKKIGGAIKYAAPAATLFFLFSIWIYSRTGEFLSALVLGALLSVLFAIVLIMGKQKFFGASRKRQEQKRDASKGKLALLYEADGKALPLLLDNMRADYPISGLEQGRNPALGVYQDQKTLFALAHRYEGDSLQPQELMDFYRRFKESDAQRGVLLLMCPASKGALELAPSLARRGMTLVAPEGLEKYFAKIGKNTAEETEPRAKVIAAFLTVQNGKRCMLAAAYMLIASIALGMKWFMPPALLLAVFAVVCRYAGGKKARLF